MKANIEQSYIGTLFSSMRNNHQGYILKSNAKEEEKEMRPIVRQGKEK